MMKRVVMAGVILMGMACGGPEPEPEPQGWTWDLPEGFPEPSVPEDNPMSEVKVELGRRLFYDKRMSAEVPGDSLGDEWKGYLFRLTG